MYRIEKITEVTQGNKERTDGRYPLRKGSIVLLGLLEVGSILMLEYVKDAEGNAKTGVLTTSRVTNYTVTEDGYIVTTSNSAYYLTKVN